MDEEKDQHVTAAPVTSENVDLEEDKKVWQMPEPVFRQSTGFLPKDFQKRFEAESEVPTVPMAVPPNPDNGAGPSAAAMTSDVPEKAQPAPAVSEIQPQPDLHEDLLIDEAPATVPVKPQRSPGMRILLAILGITAMVIFAVAFIAIIYYLFFYHPGDTTQF